MRPGIEGLTAHRALVTLLAPELPLLGIAGRVRILQAEGAEYDVYLLVQAHETLELGTLPAEVEVCQRVPDPAGAAVLDQVDF
jgi:hypothetical protein